MTQAANTETGAAERPWLTLTEAAILTGRHIDALRAMARRGKLERRKGNSGQWLVKLPEAWAEADQGNDSGSQAGGAGVALGPPRADSGTAYAADSDMVEAVAELREEVGELRLALARAEAKVEAGTALAKGEVEAVKRVAAAEVSAMREQLNAGIAARNAVIEQLQEDVQHEREEQAKLAAELAEARKGWLARLLEALRGRPPRA